MSHRGGWIRALIVGAVLSGTGLISTDAFAQCCQGGSATGANMWSDGLATSAQWPTTTTYGVAGWWTHGELEVGGQDFLNNPTPNGSIWGDTTNGGVYGLSNASGGAANGSGNYVYLGQKSLAKYYEYSIVAPGAFGGAHVATGSKDGLYQVDIWANNIGSNFDGFSDQSYLLQASKVGEQYFSFSWDGTPHIYSTSAETFYQGVGTNNLTLPPGLAADPLSHAAIPSSTNCTGCTAGQLAAWAPFSIGVNQNVNGSTTKGGLTVPGLQPAGGIIPYLYGIDLGIQRNTASAGYRWTPPDASRPEGYAWDLRADYSYMSRTGTQAAGIVEMNGFMPTNVPAPVNDSTQNFGANGEYAGTSPWGGKYTVKLAYNGSIYTDNISSYTVQNPFYPTAAGTVAGSPTAAGAIRIPTSGTCIGQGYWLPALPSTSTTPAPSSGTANCGSALMSTPPSNIANGGSATATAELPWNSRYAGTFSFVNMAQNATFLDMTNNPNAVTSPFGGVPWNQVNFGFINGNLGQPASSLNGEINTILSNNVLTTKITPELTNKLTYRFYDFDNRTPNIVFPCWVSYDGTGGTYQTNTKSGSTTTYDLVPSCSKVNPALYPGAGYTGAVSGYENTLSSLSISYIKQNAAEELNWRPSNQWNFNVAGGWEGYNYTQADAGYTNEYSTKASVDYKPFNWLTVRASGFYSDRIAGDYSYLNNVAAIQFPTVAGFQPQCTVLSSGCGGFVYSSAYQQFMFDNRQRTAANFLLDVVAFRGVTITPSIKYKDDYYPLNTNTGAPAGALAEGLRDQKMFGAGVDVGWAITRDLSFVASYYYEYYHQLLYSGTGNGTPTVVPAPGAACPSGDTCLINTTDNEFVNTVTVGLTWAAIPSRLTLDARYSVSDSIDKQVCSLCSWTNAAGVAQPVGTPFPNDTTLFQRLDATATYKFDPAWIRQTGFMGDVFARLRYTWERNAVANWQNDPLAPFTDIPGMQNAIWMAWDNPNYNVQMLAASLMMKW